MIRLDRFEALADRLEAQPERFRFWMFAGDGFKDNHCGTAGCSLGHATEMYGAECGVRFTLFGAPRCIGASFAETAIGAARAIFGAIDEETYSRLFVEDYVLDRDCTAAEAAAEIRKFVAEQRAKGAGAT